MKRFILAVAIAGAIKVLVASSAQSVQVEPKYECEGTGPTGSYHIVLTTEKRGDNYFLAWGEGGFLVGMGIKRDNQLAVAFVNYRSGGVGIALYEVREAQLLGIWGGGDGKVYTESCLVGKQA